MADRPRSAVFSSIPDAILVSGAITGEAARLKDFEMDFPPKCGGVRSERHAAAGMVSSSMQARASAGVR